MTSLHEFLTARYREEREREEGIWTVRRSLPFEWLHVCGPDGEYIEVGARKDRVPVDEFRNEYGESAADPAVLADLDAKLSIVARHSRCGSGTGYCDDGGHGWDWDDVEGGGCGDLGDLARPFANHPDYEDRWRL
ncbi:DUF6221 family protein [Streptomyces stelliscabiei]|uniref:DUF6221 family protein n=1 Tax=Streptomyces stelliscabiei TaxID=146820 RepID=UPI0029BCE2FF|nr:DUF6221 family protein [Streptomyces stelliscabiei]MDX2550102.1 DUF6221 family protein [Streptomyces stelliscabiei]